MPIVAADGLANKFPALYRRGRAWAWLVPTALLLSACATLPMPNLPGTALPTYQDAIALSGRLSVRYQQNGKDEALHGSFTWKQTSQGADINLLSPLGQTIARIAVTPSASTLTQSGQAPRRAVDVDTLTADTLGWPLPVAGLRQWLQGYAKRADGTPFTASPATDSVTTDDGWRIRYVTWRDDASPKRIDLERTTAAAGEVAIRIAIDQRGPVEDSNQSSN